MMATQGMRAILTETSVRRLVREWYRKLDVHAPLEDVMPLLAKRGLRMRFPEASLRGLGDFMRWYNRVMRIFFDEVHRVKSVKTDVRGDRARVRVVVRWEASRWLPPAARSERIVLDAYQTWDVRLSKTTLRPEIVNYVVNRLEYARGSARL